MGYRRDSQGALKWKNWRTANFATVTEQCCLPASVLESEDNWLYFLEHGYFAPIGSEPILDIDRMSEEQAIKLCEFLERQNDDGEYVGSTLNALQFKLRRGLHER